MKVYFSFSKRYALLLCTFLLLAFSAFSVASRTETQITLETEAKRVAFLKSYGFTVNDPDYVKTFTVPVKSEIYPKLKDYKGKPLTEYAYSCGDNLVIRIITDGEKLADAYCIDLETGGVHPLEGENFGTNKAG